MSMQSATSLRARRRTPLLFLCAAGTFAAGSGAAWAQALPAAQVDAGALQRQDQERRQQERGPRAAVSAAPTVRQDDAPATATVAPSSTRFILRRLDFGPSVFLDRTELDAIAARYTGQEIGFATLTSIVNQINALYRKHGVLTGRAVLPPQKVTDGRVKIDLVEAKLGQVGVSGAQYSRPGYLAGMLGSDPGETIDTAALSERIGRFNRAGSVQVEANLRPGASFGLTDLMLDVREPARYQTRLFFNNEGSQSIGREQVGVDAAINGPAGLGDRLAVYITRSRGATLGAASYSLPVNRWGGHLSASYNVGTTDVVAGPYRALGISGISHSVQLGGVQPVWQHGTWYLDLAATVGRTHSNNQVNDTPLSDTTIRNSTVGATFGGTDDNRSISVGGTVTHARASALAATERTFTVRQLNASWVENTGADQFMLVRVATQDTGSALLAPSLLFQLGGSASVRGYEVGVLSGDRGYLANVEWHRNLEAGIAGFLFFDAGQVRTAGLPRQVARSTGAGLDGQWERSLRANITVGRTLDTITPGQHKWRVTGRLSYEL
jgi:hemolysin activation/secretion protein